MDTSREFVLQSTTFLQKEFLPRILAAVEHLTDEQMWWRPNEASNSIGNLMLHLSGNVRQWIVGGVGRQPNVRDRDKEFTERSLIPRDQLIAHLTNAVDAAEKVLRNLDVTALSDRRVIQGNDVTVLEAIYHVIEHFSMHTGQILMLTKIITAKDLRLDDVPNGTV